MPEQTLLFTEETQNEALKSTPLDWIKCHNGQRKAVVACMVNCSDKCPAFWDFFAMKGFEPEQYYNVNGIGEKCMRRITYDCDRCGKKDLAPVFSLYKESQNGSEVLINEEERAKLANQLGIDSDRYSKTFIKLMELLEEDYQWRHFCEKCFMTMSGFWSRIVKDKGFQSLVGIQESVKITAKTSKSAKIRNSAKKEVREKTMLAGV